MNKDNYENQIIEDKLLRKKMKEVLDNLKDFNNQYPSNEKMTASIRLQEAIMWLGCDLRRLDDENPYPNGNDTTNTIIDPIAKELRS